MAAPATHIFIASILLIMVFHTLVTITERRLYVIIDSGASRNFISTAIVT